MKTTKTAVAWFAVLALVIAACSDGVSETTTTTTVVATSTSSTATSTSTTITTTSTTIPPTTTTTTEAIPELCPEGTLGVVPEPAFLSRFDPPTDPSILTGEGGLEIVYLCGVVEELPYPLPNEDPDSVRVLTAGFGIHPETNEDMTFSWIYDGGALVALLSSDGDLYFQVIDIPEFVERVGQGVYLMAVVVGADDPSLVGCTDNCDAVTRVLASSFELNSQMVAYLAGETTDRPTVEFFPFQPYVYLIP